MSGRPARRPPARSAGWLPVLVLAVVVLGFAGGIAASAAVISPGSESARGTAVSATAITWFRLTNLAVTTVPSVLQANASTSAPSPTTLATSNASYGLGPATSGDGALQVTFLVRNPPGLTEFELNVTFVNASAGTTSATVYLEIPSPAPAGPLLFSFFLDVGVGVPVFGHASELAQGCAVLATCP